MFNQRQHSGAVSDPDRPGPARRVATNVAAFSVSVLVLGALGVGVMEVDPERTADLAERLSAAWASLRSLAHSTTARPGIEPQRMLAAVPPRFGAEAAPAAGPAPSGYDDIAYGDRLKVTFFESVPVPLGDPAQAPGAPAPVAIFPRMDLSGEYVVDGAGGLDIPRLGWRAVTGQGTGALEAQLASAFLRTFGRPGNVHVALLDRRPVYVLGGPHGGVTVKHAPGMIVLQVLAEAGGHQRDALDTSRTIEAIRETQRLGEAQDRLARALVRQARLTAMRDGSPTVTLPPATAALLGEVLPQEAPELLREANIALTLDRQAYADRLALVNRQVDIANLELAAQNLRAVQARVLAEIKAIRLHGLEGIAARGSISQFKVMDSTVELAEAAAKREDLRATVAQAQSRVVEAEVERVKFVQAYTRQVTLDLAATAQDVGDLRRGADAMRAVVAVLADGQDTPLKARAGLPSLSIVRRGQGGTLVIPAQDTTPLLPGDVLQIGQGRGAAQPDAPGAPNQPLGASGTAVEANAPSAQF